MLTFIAADFIEAEPAEVLEVYRSERAVFLSDGEAEWQAQAFICIVKQENRPRVHIALHFRDIQISLLYLAEAPPPALTDPEKPRQQAEALLNLLGASMQEVKLKYSPAMREVILREIPVLLPPEAAKKISREKEGLRSEWRRLVSEQAEQEKSLAAEGELSLTQWTQRKQELDALAEKARQAADYLAAEERMAEKAAALQKAMEPFLQQVNADEIAAAEKAGKEHRRKAQELAEQRIAELEKRILLLEKQLAAGKDERVVLTREKATREQELIHLGQKLAQAEKGEQAAIAKLEISEKARKAAENRQAELEEILRRQQEELAILAAASERLKQEKPIASAGEENDRLASLRKDFQETRELLATSLAEREKLEAARAAAEKRLAELATQTAAERSAGGSGAEKRLLQVEEELRRAQERTDFLRTEVERLAAAKIAAEKRLAEVETVGVTPAKPASSHRPLENAAKAEPAPPPHVVRRPPPADALFRVDWDLAGIDAAPEDICEMHQAMTRVRLSLEGYPHQSCAAYLLVTRKGEEKRIHIAFYLTASNRALIYVPVRRPESPAAIEKTLKEAHKFLQVVGIELETVPLGKDPKKRAAILAENPVLLPAAKRAGNF